MKLFCTVFLALTALSSTAFSQAQKIYQVPALLCANNEGPGPFDRASNFQQSKIEYIWIYGEQPSIRNPAPALQLKLQQSMPAFLYLTLVDRQMPLRQNSIAVLTAASANRLTVKIDQNILLELPGEDSDSIFSRLKYQDGARTIEFVCHPTHIGPGGGGMGGSN